MKEVGVKPTIEKGIYQHYKGGIYEVLEVACHSETLDWYVVYESRERKNQGLPSLWIRPYDMFVETVTVDGQVTPRFKKIED